MQIPGIPVAGKTVLSLLLVHGLFASLWWGRPCSALLALWCLSWVTERWSNNVFGDDYAFWWLLQLFHAERGTWEDLGFGVYVCVGISPGEVLVVLLLLRQPRRQASPALCHKAITSIVSILHVHADTCKSTWHEAKQVRCWLTVCFKHRKNLTEVHLSKYGLALCLSWLVLNKIRLVCFFLSPPLNPFVAVHIGNTENVWNMEWRRNSPE